MKRLFNTTPAPRQIDVALLIARIFIAALMLTHGLPKLQMLLGEAPVQFMGVLGMGETLSLTLAIFAEVFCSIFLLFGFGTRLATLPLIFTMLIAVFHIHTNDPFAKQELGLHFLLIYLLLLILGSGKYSLDALLKIGRDRRKVLVQ